MSRVDMLTDAQNYKHTELSDWCDCSAGDCYTCPFFNEDDEKDTSKFHWCHCDNFTTDEEKAIFIEALDRDFEYLKNTLLKSNEVNEDEETPIESNAVDHPSHYNQGGVECIDAMVSAFGNEATAHFCLINAFKYVWRASDKNGMEDIDKAIWYLNKYKELIANG